jgi:hypothetical protein
MNTMSLRDTILTSPDLKEEVVTVPEWGNVDILLRGMTGKQRINLVDRASTSGMQKSFMYADILIAVARDPETDEMVFDPADREALSDKAGGVLERLSQKALELSGVAVGDEDEKEIEEDPTSGGA